MVMRAIGRLIMVPLAFLLFRWRQHGRPEAFVVGAYLVLAGAIRFAIEFLRVDVRVLGGLSVAHFGSLAAIFIGAVILAAAKGQRPLNAALDRTRAR